MRGAYIEVDEVPPEAAAELVVEGGEGAGVGRRWFGVEGEGLGEAEEGAAEEPGLGRCFRGEVEVEGKALEDGERGRGQPVGVVKGGFEGALVLECEVVFGGFLEVEIF